MERCKNGRVGRFGLFLILLILGLVCANDQIKAAKSHSPLVKSNEKVLFSFKVVKSNKVMTIAVAKNEGYIVYRFGTKDKVELEFPQDKQRSWEQFTYAYYLRGGGPQNAGMDINSLTFTNGDCTYEVYHDYTAESDEYAIGIRIRDHKKGKDFEIKGDVDSSAGSLIDLRDNSMIKVESMF